MSRHMSEIEEMLRTIETECRLTRNYTGIEAFRPAVMDAMKAVPRDEFVPLTIKPYAWANNALPIGEGQTISQPFIVALMTDLLCPTKDNLILEVGTGSGYQAAVLSLLVRHIYTLEIVPSLAAAALDRLEGLGYRNVTVRHGDGYGGWAEHSPYDGIIVTAASPRIPPPLLEQLKPGGRLVIPLGSPYGAQELVVVETNARGKKEIRNILPVAFVPLTGFHSDD